jgi:hypothetical protein
VVIHIEIGRNEIVRGEAAENGERKDFTPIEYVAITQALRPFEKAAAKARQAASLKRGTELSRQENYPHGERVAAKNRRHQT